MKKFLIITSFFIAAYSSVSLSAELLKDKYLESYVSQCLDYWFYPYNDNSELRQLTRIISKEIRASNTETYEWHWDSFSYESAYSLDYVEQLLRGISIDYIKERSYDVAKALYNHKVARHISSLVADDLLTTCSQLYELPSGIFAAYGAPAIRERIIQIYQWVHNQPSAPQPQVQIYPSKECCICYESFRDVPQIFLTPCGHDICVQCAERWFYTENKSSCPQCRQKVNKKALRNTINEALLAIAHIPLFN